MTAHEDGYRAYRIKGLAAKCPHDRQTDASARWWSGFNKARNEDVGTRRLAKQATQ